MPRGASSSRRSALRVSVTGRLAGWLAGGKAPAARGPSTGTARTPAAGCTAGAHGVRRGRAAGLLRGGQVAVMSAGRCSAGWWSRKTRARSSSSAATRTPRAWYGRRPERRERTPRGAGGLDPGHGVDRTTPGAACPFDAALLGLGDQVEGDDPRVRRPRGGSLWRSRSGGRRSGGRRASRRPSPYGSGRWPPAGPTPASRTAPGPRLGRKCGLGELDVCEGAPGLAGLGERVRVG